MKKIYQISDEVVALVGSPGSGKTYISACMAKTHIELSSENLVVSNVPFKKHPQIVQLDPVPTIQDLSSHTGKNVLFVIDEITRIWGNHSLKEVRPEFDDFVAMIRHRGSRIVVITQSVQMLPLVFRSRVASVYQLVSTRDHFLPIIHLSLYDVEYLIYNLTKKINRMYCLQITKYQVSGRRKVIDGELAFFDSEIFKFYQSVTMGKQWQDPYLGPFRGILFALRKCWFRVFLIFAVIALFLYFFVFDGFSDFINTFSNLQFKGQVQNEKKKVSPSPSPLVPFSGKSEKTQKIESQAVFPALGFSGLEYREPLSPLEILSASRIGDSLVFQLRGGGQCTLDLFPWCWSRSGSSLLVWDQHFQQYIFPDVFR